MRGIHDGPDCTTWPDPPKRWMLASLIVAALAVGTWAGVTDGPDGVDPLGDRPMVVDLSADGTIRATVAPIIPHDAYGWGCSTSQRIECDRRCAAAAPDGYVSIASICEPRMVPMPFPSPGLAAYWCRCTWVRA